MERQGTQQVRDVMTRDVETIEPDATLQDAAQMMEALDVGPLPVVEDGLVVGMLTDRDVIARSVGDARDPQTTTVRDIMTTDVVSCFEDDDVTEAAHLMQQEQLKRLVVLNKDQELVGIVSLADLPVSGV
ncbi:MAG: CBS domain-containing protein [Herpetosiphonaceae bacterium]|nr:CBS domain-containing protein [Herpetosiphonaceae bacterium]